MKKIAITGGIGSGKTLATDRFSLLGIPILDADEFSRQETKKGSMGYKKIVDAFGNQALSKNREIDRAFLRQVIFTDSKKRLLLESIIHPIIKEKMDAELDKLHAPYTVFSIPLLVEKNRSHEFNQVIVITASIEIREARVSKRSNLSKKTFLDIVNSQATDEQRASVADFIIENNGTKESLFKKIDKIHEELMILLTNK